MNKIINLILNTIAICFIALFIGRLVIPQTVENVVIKPTRNVPVFGKVLGESWGATDYLNQKLTNQTVQLTDNIESSGDNLDDQLSQISDSDNPSQEIQTIIEDSVNQKIEDVKDLPADTLEKLKQEVRNQMYEQVCKSYIEEKENPEAE
jgi:hypothetical protein